MPGADQEPPPDFTAWESDDEILDAFTTGGDFGLVPMNAPEATLASVIFKVDGGEDELEDPVPDNRTQEEKEKQAEMTAEADVQTIYRAARLAAAFQAYIETKLAEQG